LGDFLIKCYATFTVKATYLLGRQSRRNSNKSQ